MGKYPPFFLDEKIDLIYNVSRLKPKNMTISGVLNGINFIEYFNERCAIMKKSRKILSVVLAVIVAFASMPMVYTVSAVPEVHAATQTGTIDNPTTNVKKEGSIERKDLHKVNLSVAETSYYFYQRIDDEYFTYTQSVGFQQVNSGASDRTLMFDSVSDYTGGSNITGESDETIVGTQGYYENPIITNNNTADFVKNSDAKTEWIPINENAKGVVSGRADLIPYNFQMAGSSFDLSGCKVYTWHNKVVFKGSAKGESTLTGTNNYYRSYKYHWTATDGTHAEMDARVGTTISIIDARELYKELLKAENIMDYPHKYTDAYISSVTATYNSIPEDLRDFSALYTQEEIDKYTKDLKDISKNSADYTVYNNYYEQLSALDNHTGSWTDDSFAAFKAEIADIDAGLPKNLDRTKQATVDAAVQALVNAYNKLVYTDVGEETEGNDASFYDNSDGDNGDMNITVDDTSFKFMQTKDNQVFQYSQLWTMLRDGGSTARKFKGLYLDTTLTEDSGKSICVAPISVSENKTQEYINMLTDDSKYVQTADNEYTSVSATEYACWWEYDANGTPNGESTFVDATGTLDANRDFEFTENKTYYVKNSPKIQGNPAGTYGAVSLNYVLRLGWTYKTGGFLGLGATTNARHFHVNNTIEITDVRQLIAAEAAAQEIIANPEGYSESYVEALKAAVSAVPQYMLYGSEYYPQSEVDAFTNSINAVLANTEEEYADYTDFNIVFDMLSAIENKGNYTPTSFEAFQKTIYEINANTPKNLPASQQSVVDQAVKDMFNAQQQLEYRHLNDDESLSSTDITESMGNNPVNFTVSSTEYNFMQIHDGQDFVIKTDLTIKNNRSSYKSKLLSLKISQLDGDPNSANYYNNLCPNRGDDTDEGCHYGDNVLRNDWSLLLPSITSGLNKFDTANAAGDIAEFNTWVNNYGTALTSGGIISDGVELNNEDASASAIMHFTGATGGAENLAATNLQYALRLGWSYQEVVLGVEGDSVSRHAHIPVTLNITDARALNSVYQQSMNAVLGKTEEKYTLATLEALYDVLVTIPSDMAYGTEYYTQEQVNEAYAKLNGAYTTLNEGADYSEYFEQSSKAEEIIASNNTDAYGNKLYSQEAYDEYVATVTQIMNGVEKDLTATEENQAIIDAATQALKDAEATLNGNKFADYEQYEEALKKAEDIVNAPEGTYTDETVKATQDAIDQANKALEDAAAAAGTDKKELPESSQPAIDGATDILENAVKDSLYKLDYTDYEKALADALAVKNDPQVYTNSAYQAYLDKLAEIDAGVDKDLPDYEVNRETLRKAIAAIEAARAELENNKLADYSAYDEAKANADAVVNDDGNGNEVYNPQAFEAFKNTVESIDSNLNRDLPASQQTTVDGATDSIKEAQANLENNRWADYTELDANKALVQEILDKEAEAPGTYTQATIDAANQAMNAANKIPDGLVVGKDNVYQNQIDTAADGLKSVLDNAKEKADYSALDDALARVDEILNAPEGTYTDSTVNAAQQAKDAAETLNKDLPKDNQADIDAVTDALNNAADNAQKKADYSEFNDVKAELEKIVNAPEGTYTDATVNAAQEALNQADALNKDLPESVQPNIDYVTDLMKDVINNAQEKADYTDYNDKKTELEEIIAGGNTDPVTGEKVFDDAVYEEVKKNFEEIDTALDKDLPSTEQETVDNATDAIQNLLDSRIYTVTFVGTDPTTVLATIDYNGGTLLGDIAGKPTYPENDKADVYSFLGWADAENALYTDETPVKGDITLHPAGEFIKIAPKADSTLDLEAVEGYITGIEKDTTVSEIKDELENDLLYIEIKDYTGADLTDEALVGTGSTITLKSKYTGVIYETKTILVYGDVDGDGDVDDSDYNIARRANVGDATEEYTIDGIYREYFFLANDLNGDGYIDVLDSSLLALVKNGKKVIK